MEDQCSGCAKGFSLSRRRHHCRGCSAAVCDACSRQRLAVVGYEGKQRVCRGCFRDGTEAAGAAAERADSRERSGSMSSTQSRDRGGEVSAVAWQRNADAKKCHCCSKGFSLSRRKHHCRACGHVVCDPCSLNRQRVVVDDPDAPLARVCDRCSSSRSASTASASGGARSIRYGSRASDVDSADGSGSDVGSESEGDEPRVRTHTAASRKMGAKYGVDWQADRDAERCAECDAKFTALRRVHHCRRCGGCVCARCSRSKAVVEGSSKPQRVCDGCEGRRASSASLAEEDAADDLADDLGDSDDEDEAGAGGGGVAWERNADVSQCGHCEARFSVRRRKHHCRRCGRVVCGRCSSGKQLLQGAVVPQRVCDGCFDSGGGEDDELERRIAAEAARIAEQEREHAAEVEAAELVAHAAAEVAARLGSPQDDEMLQADVAARVQERAAALAEEERAADLERRLAEETEKVAQREAEARAALEAEAKRVAEQEERARAQQAALEAEAMRIAAADAAQRAAVESEALRLAAVERGEVPVLDSSSNADPVQRLFDLLDLDGDGVISIRELVLGRRLAGQAIDYEEERALFADLAGEHDVITFEDLQTAVLGSTDVQAWANKLLRSKKAGRLLQTLKAGGQLPDECRPSEAALRQAFSAMDRNGDGTISVTEWHHAEKTFLGDLSLFGGFQGMDANGDCAISWEEFLQACSDSSAVRQLWISDLVRATGGDPMRFSSLYSPPSPEASEEGEGGELEGEEDAELPPLHSDERPLSKREVRALLEAGASLAAGSQGRAVITISDLSVPEHLDVDSLLVSSPRLADNGSPLRRTLSKRQVRALVQAGGRLTEGARQRSTDGHALSVRDFYVPDDVDVDAVLQNAPSTPQPSSHTGTPVQVLSKREVRALMNAGATPKDSSGSSHDLLLEDFNLPEGLDVFGLLAAAAIGSPNRGPPAPSPVVEASSSPASSLEGLVRPSPSPPAASQSVVLDSDFEFEDEDEDALLEVPSDLELDFSQTSAQTEDTTFSEFGAGRPTSLSGVSVDSAFSAFSAVSAVSARNSLADASVDAADAEAEWQAEAERFSDALDRERAVSPEEQLKRLGELRKRATSEAGDALHRLSQELDPADLAPLEDETTGLLAAAAPSPGPSPGPDPAWPAAARVGNIQRPDSLTEPLLAPASDDAASQEEAGGCCSCCVVS